MSATSNPGDPETRQSRGKRSARSAANRTQPDRRRGRAQRIQPEEDAAGDAGRPSLSQAPTVVAVLVAANPGDWFEETLGSLAAQEYDELAVLVLVPEGCSDPAARVAAVLPGAFVRSVAGRHYAAAVNEARETIAGAAFLLLCHDDVALEPDATRLLVEESFRSNAGVVTPKMTSWDDLRVLSHVGQSADKTGAVVDRLQEGEIDHGQHDGVRDVFVAPGGCTLIRADLFADIEGFDADIQAMGENLDLCWRAQIAGARVVVAPQAKVRHLEALVSGRRSLRGGRSQVRAAPLARLERRYELHAVLSCYSAWHLLRVLPQVLVLSIGEALGALASGDTRRVGDVVGAWIWNLQSLGEIRQRRRIVRTHRQRRDRDVRRLQSHGSVRLSAYITQVAHLGLLVARGTPVADPSIVSDGQQPELTGSVGGAFSEDSSFDEIEDRRRVGPPPPLSTQRSRVLTWIVVAVLLIVGSRQLLASGFPVVGQFLPLPSWTSTWHHLFSGWQSAGLGSGSPATPAYAVLGFIGIPLFGATGLVQTVLVLGCLPVGALGVSRLLRPLCPPRGRLIGALAYLGLPLVYNALAQGRWDGMVAFAAAPWIVARLARASGLAPFESPRGWRGTLVGQMVTLGVVEAIAVSFAPAVALVVLLVAVAIPVGSLVAGRPGGWRALLIGLGATVATVVLCAPWSFGVLGAGHGALRVLGLPLSTAGSLSWSSILRFAVGPIGSSPINWLLIVVALLPLLVGRRARLAWAVRLSVLALMSWFLAWLVARGWTGSFAPQVDVLLAPAACAVAASIGIGMASFELELAQHRFGWRQLVSVGALVAGAVGLVPVLAQVGDGTWGLPRTGIEQPLAWMSSNHPPGGFRVLWLADPRALVGGGWSVAPGLAYTVTDGGLPNSSNLWAPAETGPANQLADAIQLAENGRTSNLGTLLAPSSVRYIVAMQTLAPSAPGLQTATAFPTPPSTMQGLEQQSDLRTVPGGEGYTVFANDAYIPERAQRAPSVGLVPTQSQWATPANVRGWHGVLGNQSGQTQYQGTTRGEPLVAAYAPAGSWHLMVDGRDIPQRPAYGWAAQFQANRGQGSLAVDPGPLVPLGVTVEIILWALVAVALLLSRREGTRIRRLIAAYESSSRDDRRGEVELPSADSHIGEPPAKGSRRRARRPSAPNEAPAETQ